MRLPILDHGHRRPVRAFFAATRLLTRIEMADIAKVLLYRPEFFGRPMLDLTAHLMRGDGEWPIAERELIAMRLAQMHRSPFCIDSHAELTRIASDGKLDPFAVPRPELAATLNFLISVSFGPVASPAETLASSATGVSADAFTQALEIALVWNVINRLANAFGFVLREGQLAAGTAALHRMGYRFPVALTRGGGHRQPRTSDCEALIERLRCSVFDSAGCTPQTLRRMAASAKSTEPWSQYVAKVAHASHTVDADDIGDLQAAGCTEDQIFEMTVAAALGAALASLSTGRAALESECT